MMSTVIKAGAPMKMACRLTTIDLADHLAEAERIIDGARAEACAIVDQTRREAAQARQSAEKQGYDDGYARGQVAGLEAGRVVGLAEARERFERELGSLRDALGRLLEEFESAKKALIVAGRQDALEFAVALAGKVAKRVGELDRSVASANAEQALQLVADQTDVTVRAHPVDLESLQCFAKELAARIAECRHFAIVPDAGISPGGCVVTTPKSRVDARLESQMDEIARLLLGDQEASGDTPGDGTV